MATTKNGEAVDLLQAIGDLMELRGDESFRVRSYREPLSPESRDRQAVEAGFARKKSARWLRRRERQLGVFS